MIFFLLWILIFLHRHDFVLLCYFVHFYIPGFVQSLKFQEEGERITLHIAPACAVFISWWTIHLGLTSKWPFWFQTRQQALAYKQAGWAYFSSHIICVNGHKFGAWEYILVNPGLFYCCSECIVYFESLMIGIPHQGLDIHIVHQPRMCWRDGRGWGMFYRSFSNSLYSSCCSMVLCSYYSFF